MANYSTQSGATAVASRHDIMPSNQSAGASPYVYQNNTTYAIDLIVNSGTVSSIEFSRDNATWYNSGMLVGVFRLSIGDRLKITYTLAPTITIVPR